VFGPELKNGSNIVFSKFFRARPDTWPAEKPLIPVLLRPIAAAGITKQNLIQCSYNINTLGDRIIPIG
jgi:hypothetical protein